VFVLGNPAMPAVLMFAAGTIGAYPVYVAGAAGTIVALFCTVLTAGVVATLLIISAPGVVVAMLFILARLLAAI